MLPTIKTDQGVLSYNDHLQLSALRYFKSGNSTDILNLAYDYGANNNGQIQAVRYYTSPGTEDATRSQYFSYDGWSRLSAAHTGIVSASTAGTWSLTWEYDRLGNRLKQNVIAGNTTGTDIGQPQFSVDVNTNHITNTGFRYDAAEHGGNLIADGTNTYAYDGANRMKHLAYGDGTADYTYFGPLRIKRVVSTTSSTNTTVYVYSGSKPIVEYTGSDTKEHIYSGSGLLATISTHNSVSTTTYHHPDHLSNRAETDTSGAVARSFGHAPFGEKWYESGTADKSKFTTYERDAESGLDYAQFRYLASGQGRFMGADLLGGSLDVPQSLNRYVYVTNDPINAVDPLGLLRTCSGWAVNESGEGDFTGCATITFTDGPNHKGDEDQKVRPGGQGGSKKKKKLCTVIVGWPGYAAGQALLPPQAEIQFIFNAAGVDVEFTGGSGADFQIENQNLSYLGTGVLGYAPPGTNQVLFDSNAINAAGHQAGASAAAIYTATGVIQAHELGHQLLGPFHSDKGVMRQGTDIGDAPFKPYNFSSDLLFTKPQALAIRLKCQKLESHHH